MMWMGLLGIIRYRIYTSMELIQIPAIPIIHIKMLLMVTYGALIIKQGSIILYIGALNEQWAVRNWAGKI